jgi:hypothetical protein
MKYLVIVSFAGPDVGSHSAGEEIELNAAQAKDLAPFIQPVVKIARREEVIVETADAQIEGMEQAVVKPRRSKKGESDG